MGSVTKTITETIGEVQQTTTFYFTSFEDFMEYERAVNAMESGTTTPISIDVAAERLMNNVKDVFEQVEGV